MRLAESSSLPFDFPQKRRQFILSNGVALTVPGPLPVCITISSSIRRLTLAATARPSPSTPRFAIPVAFASVQIAINHAAAAAASSSSPQWTSQEWQSKQEP